MKIFGGLRSWFFVCGRVDFWLKYFFRELFFCKFENFPLSLIHIDQNFKFWWQGKTLRFFFSLMKCLNTIMMPEINYTNNFTLEINFGWPPYGWVSPNCEKGSPGGCEGSAPAFPEPYFWPFTDDRGVTPSEGVTKKFIG